MLSLHRQCFSPSLPPLPRRSPSSPSPPFSLLRRRRKTRRSPRIVALDAAQPYDYETKLAADYRRASPRLKIAIIGFGNFGQFLARTFLRHGHEVLAHSRSDYSRLAGTLGVAFFSNADDLCEEHPDVILLCTSIISTESVLRSLPFNRLRRSTLFADVLSVKEFSKSLMLNLLPEHFDIVCTHPMFGPESAKNGWEGLNFVFEKVRVWDEEARVSRCERFLGIFAREGCEMIEMSCAEHDRVAAESQFITHTVGRVLEALRLDSTPINTKGYETLLDLVENTAADSFDLYYGLFVYNQNSLEVLDRLDLAFEALRKLLFGRLLGVVRKQLFGGAAVAKEQRSDAVNGAALPPPAESRRVQRFVPPIDSRIQIFRRFDNESKLKIAIVGFGNFGQFLAKTIVGQGHIVLAHSRSDYSAVAQRLGVSFFFSIDDLCEEHPDVILLCTSILSTDKVLSSLPLQRLKRSTLFVDVLSVKEFPRSLFIQRLPQDFDILCTHPMFGPESGKNGWKSLTFVFDKVRIGNDESRVLRCETFLDIFAREGCNMVEMTCAEHDKHAAGSQFITHTMGRILEKLGLESTPINTKGYETLLTLVENTAGDSFDLYYGLFMYNVNAMEQLERLDLAFKSLMKQLFGRLHGFHRKQLFDTSDDLSVFVEKPVLMLSENRVPQPPSSEVLSVQND